MTRAGPARSLHALVLLLSLVASARAWGQEFLGASAPTATDGTTSAIYAPRTHAWLLARRASGGSVLSHLPPRRAASMPGEKASGTVDGALRSAALLEESPTHAAAWSDRVYFVQQGASGFPIRSKRVLSLRAAPAGVSDLWRTEPDSPTIHPSLPQDYPLVSFAATATGPWALLWRTQPGEPPRPMLLALTPREWREVALPPEASAAIKKIADDAAPPPSLGSPPKELVHACRLLADERGLSLLVLSASGGIQEWSVATDAKFAALLAPPTIGAKKSAVKPTDKHKTGTPGESEPAASPVLHPNWLRRPDGGLPAPGLPVSAIEFLSVGRQRVAVCHLPDFRVGLYAAVVQGGWRELREPVTGLGPKCAALGLSGVGRVALVWETPPAGTNANARATLSILELSASTGREFYRGPVVVATPVTLGDFRAIAFVLLMVMSLVLVFVLRSEKRDAPIVLPSDCALADPARRAAACLLDLALALGAASGVLGTSPALTLASGELFAQDGLMLLGLTLVIAALVGACGEHFFGRTPGKLITGCAVVHALAGHEHAPLRPSFPRILLRNLAKWGLLPLCILAFSDPTFRHPADRLGRSVVVTALPPEEPDES